MNHNQESEFHPDALGVHKRGRLLSHSLKRTQSGDGCCELFLSTEVVFRDGSTSQPTDHFQASEAVLVRLAHEILRQLDPTYDGGVLEVLERIEKKLD